MDGMEFYGPSVFQSFWVDDGTGEMMLLKKEFKRHMYREH